MYERVIPRDLFNEAKLLKSLGRLALLIHDGKAPAGLTVTHDGDEFRISQNTSDGAFMVTSRLDYHAGSTRLILSSPLNSRRPYPLTCFVNNTEVPVFEDDGTLSPEFVKLVELLTLAAKTGI